LLRGGALKGSHRLAENELLRLKYMADGFEQFLVDRPVLAFQVQHGHRLGRACSIQGRGTREGRGVRHVSMLPAAEGASSRRAAFKNRFVDVTLGLPELKSMAIPISLYHCGVSRLRVSVARRGLFDSFKCSKAAP